MKDKKEEKKSTCPNCGYCPECGQARQWVWRDPVPYIPPVPYIYPGLTPIIWGDTSASGNSRYTSNITVS